MTETNEAVIHEALTVIDKALAQMMQRELVSTGEVTDVLLDVRGFRTGVRASPVSVGRVRRNRRLMPWFTMRLSTPSKALNHTAPSRWWAMKTATSTPVICQMTLKSPTMEAAWNTRSGTRLPRTRSSAASTERSNVLLIGCS